VLWVDGRLSFDHLQLRLARRAARAGPEAPPASYVAFDVLALDGQDQRGLTYTARRARLEHLSAGWAPPLEICPSTADRNEATGWSTDYRRPASRAWSSSRPLAATGPAGATGSR
jgi:ATP-dependent DNA ligase